MGQLHKTIYRLGKEEKCPVTLISDVSYNSSIKFSTSTSSTGDSLMMSDAFSSLDSGSLSSSTKILFPSPSAVLSMGTAQPNKSQSVDEKSDIDTFSYAEPLDGMLSKPAAYLEKPAIVIPHFAKSTHIDFKTERNPASMFGTSAKSPKDRSSFLPSPNLMKDKALGSDKDTQTKKRDINSLAMKHFKGQEEGKDSKDLRRFDSWYSDRAIQEIISSKQSQLVLRCVFLPLHSIELPQAEEEKDSIEEDLIENITKNAETLSNPKNVPQKAGKDDVSKKLKDDFTIDKTAFDQSKSDDWGKIEEQDDFDIIMKDCEAIEATKKENETKDLKVSQSFEKQFQCMQILKNHIQASHACFVSFEPDQMGSNKHFIFGLYVNSYLLIIDPMGKNPRWDFLEKLAIVKKNHNIEKVFFSTTKLQDDPNGDVSCGPICTELLLHLSQSNKEYIYTTLKFLSTQKSEKSLEDKESTCFAIDLSDTKLLPETLKQLKGAKGKEEYMSLMSNIRQSHLAHIQNGSADDESNGYEQYVFSYMIQDRINLISLDEDSRCQELVKRFKQKLRTIISPPDVAQQIAQQRSYVRPVRHATMSSRDGGLAEEKKAKQMPTSRGS